MGKSNPGRFTTHRVRADEFQARTCYPSREAYPKDLGNRFAQELPAWKEEGPLNSGGRLTDLLVDPANANHVIVAAAAGGVYESRNAGRKWTYLWDGQMATLNIGSLAFDPSKPGRLYAGTGEANLSGDNYPGVGLFRLDPGQSRWDLVHDTLLRFLPVDESNLTFPFSGLPRRIGTIAVDPFDSNHLFVGGVTHSGEENSGLFESFDGGATFDSAEDANGRGGKLVSRRHRNGMHPFISEMGYFCHSVVFHPARKGVVLAAVEAQGTMSGIWVSHDGGQSWNQAREGLPPGDQFGRTTLHIAGASEVVYALSGRPRTGELLGMYRSSDLGERWTPLRMPKAFGARGQFSYNNCVAADRKRPGTVAAGGVDLFVSLDGGENWRQSSSGDLPAFHSQYAHHDHHGLAIVGKRIYSANDGGFAISNDLGETWETRNNGLSLAMLYDLDVSPMNAESLGGGCQDLGVWLRGPLQPRQTKSERALRRELRGDGGWTCFHPAEPHTVFASTQRMTIYRHRAEEGWQELSIGASKQETRSVWMAVLAMDRSDRRKGEARALYVGSTRVWRSLDQGDTWQAVSPHLDGSAITALEVASANPNFVYVGTVNGGFFRSTDAGESWSGNLAGPLSPGRLITRIFANPLLPELVLYTLGTIADERVLDEGGGFDTSGGAIPLRFLRTGYESSEGDRRVMREFWHVYGSHDAGDTWFCDVASGMPNLPHNAVVFLPGDILVLAHDAGVIATNNGRDYQPVTGNLPNVRVTDLVYHEKSQTLFAATYGRGIWSVPLAKVHEVIAPASGETTAPSPVT